MEREYEQRERMDHDLAVEAPLTEASDAPTRESFSTKGEKPEIAPDLFNVTPMLSASERAYGGEGLEAVQKLKNPTPGQVARLIEKHPTEQDLLMNYVREEYGAEFAQDVATALQDSVDKSKGLQPALSMNNQAAKLTDDEELETELAPAQNVAPEKTKEQQRAERSITDSLDAAKADAGVQDKKRDDR